MSRDFKFTRYNLPLYLYTAEIMWTLWYITVSWLVHMCKQDIGMRKVIARTYQGSWSRRGELCYQLHTAIPMTQPSFWCYQIFMKKWELYISAKFEQNSENKESAYQIYKVCICHYALCKVKRRTLWGILVIPGLCRQSGFRIKNSISDMSHMSCPWSEENPCYFRDKGQVQTWSLNFALFQHS